MSDASTKSNLFLVKPDLVKEWHPTKNGSLTPKNVPADHDTKVWWLCENGHEWEAKVKDRIMGEACYVCVKAFAREKYQKDEAGINLNTTLIERKTLN